MINKDQNSRNKSEKENRESTDRKGENGKLENQSRYGDVGYSGDSVRGEGLECEDDYNRINYIPDNDENHSEKNRDYEDSQFGTSGTFGYRGDNCNNEEDNNLSR